MDTNNTNLQQSQKSQKFIDWFGLLLLIVVAIAIRLFINFSTHLMPGINAAYYPVQVRSLLENGRLGFPDLPFVFYFEAIFAKILQFVGLCDLDGCIMVTSKIIDSILYPLIAVPAFLLTKLVISNQKAPRWIRFISPLLVAVSIFALIMMADFQKNSIGLMWSLFYIYFLYKAAKNGGSLNYVLAGVFFVLTGLTHLGSLGFVIAFSLSFFFFFFIFQREKRINLLKMLSGLFLVGGLVSFILFFFDPQRLERLISVFLLPIKMFKNPTIFGILQGQIPLQPPHLIGIFVAHLLVIVGIILLFIKRKEMSSQEKTLFVSLLVVTAFMASPFLEADLGNRLYLMVYVPAAILLIPILKYILGKWKRLILVAIIVILMVGPVPMALKLGMRSAKSITDEAYQDLFKLKSVIADPERTLIITRHGLEWWTAWALEVDVSQEWGIKEEMLKKYDVVYYLRQESGQGNFGPFGPGGPSFPEVVIPPEAKIVYQDEFYILAKVPEGSLRHPYEEPKGPEKR